MNVFVFKPSNTPVGKFNIQTLDEVIQGLTEFASTQTVQPYDYLECQGKQWTILQGLDGLELQEGRVVPPAKPPGEIAAKPNTLSKRYADAYATVNAVRGFGAMIKVLGWLVLGFGLIFGIVQLGSSFSSEREAGMLVMIAGAVACVLLLALGTLIRAVGQILSASLDTAVATSPLATVEEKIRLLS